MCQATRTMVNPIARANAINIINSVYKLMGETFQGYYFLKNGDVIQAIDEWMDDSGVWHKISGEVGEAFSYRLHMPHRRKVEAELDHLRKVLGD